MGKPSLVPSPTQETLQPQAATTPPTTPSSFQRVTKLILGLRWLLAVLELKKMTAWDTASTRPWRVCSNPTAAGRHQTCFKVHHPRFHRLVRPITIQTTGKTNPVNPTAFRDTTSVSELDEPQQDSMWVDSDALMGLEIDLSQEEHSHRDDTKEWERMTLTQPEGSDEEEGEQTAPTLPDGISVFSSEN